MIRGILLLLCLTGCSAQVQFQSPFKMSDEEFSARVAELVNPPLTALNKKIDELKNEKKDPPK